MEHQSSLYLYSIYNLAALYPVYTPLGDGKRACIATTQQLGTTRLLPLPKWPCCHKTYCL